MNRTLYRNGRFFTAESPQPWAEAIVVDDAILSFVGDERTASALAGDAAQVVDLGGSLVLPGFTDAHSHLLWAGEALGQIQLVDARTLDEIQDRLRAAKQTESVSVLWGRGWLFDSIPGGRPTAEMIDAAISDIPVILDANDYHSCWVNTEALSLLGITNETPDPPGGKIGRHADGHPDGMLYETAVQQFVWPLHSALTTDASRDEALEAMMQAYLAAGVTAAADMALDDDAMNAILRALGRNGGRLPIRVAGYWLISDALDPAAKLEAVARVSRLADMHQSEWFKILGIKIVLDGVIDACTAALSQPYADGSHVDTIWGIQDLQEVVAAADAAGLQIAVHAIGDRASTIALDAFEGARIANGDRPRRHRIEHLEYAAPGTAERMARLGVTASMQPVHSDPAIYANWAAQLGEARAERGFAWSEYEEAGALLAFSTDTPTAPHQPLPNVYVASTRASALDPAYPAVYPERALPLERVLHHATRDAAASVGDETYRGSLRSGLAADFVVLDVDPFISGLSALLSARPTRTVVAGNAAFVAP